MTVLVPEEFRFLVDDFGFREHRAEAWAGGLEVTWKHPKAGTALRLLVDPDGGSEALLGRLDRGGRVRPLDRDTIDHDWVLLGPPAPLELTARNLRSYGRRLLDPGRFFHG